MANLRVLAVLALLPAFPAVAVAADPVTEKKPPVIQEKAFEIPFDFKSRSDFSIGDPSSIPPGVMPNYSVEAKRPFLGFGITRPLGEQKR